MVAVILLTLPCLLFQDSMLAEKEREWNGMKTQLSLELERVRGELEETKTQFQLLRDSSEKVNHVCCITV